MERKGAPVDIPRRKASALLAYLAVTGQSHSRDALATLLWPEHNQQRARASLRVALATLNRAISESWLQVDRENVHLGARAVPSPDSALWLDVSAFRHRVAACRAHCDPQKETCPSCLASLAEAAGICRDHFLAGFSLRDSPAFDEWQFFEAESLRSELAYALELLARTHGQDLYPAYRADQKRTTESARSALDEAAWGAAWQEGQAMTPD
jgi:DNA-binding SARP family transcriptional activator